MSFTTLKNISDIGEPQISEIIRDNIVTFLDWGLLKVGNYFNVSIPTSGAYGGSRHILRPVSDPRYTDGQVWEGYRQNWVWESGLSNTTDPITISGVFVNNTFNPNSGENFYVNYPEGRIIFDTAIATSSVVQLEYSHKWVKTVAARDLPWFKEGHTRSFRVDDSNFIPGSGIRNQLAQTRIELPVIAVETLNDRSYEGYQLGGSSWTHTDVVFHVISEDDTMAYRLADILANQSEKTIYLFDTDKMAKDNRFPLDHNGSKSSNPLTYPDLVTATGDGGFRYTADVMHGKMTISESSAQSQEKILPRLYHSSAKWKTEVILNKV
jgi:hypothetical protein